MFGSYFEVWEFETFEVSNYCGFWKIEDFGGFSSLVESFLLYSRVTHIRSLLVRDAATKWRFFSCSICKGFLAFGCSTGG